LVAVLASRRSGQVGAVERSRTPDPPSAWADLVPLQPPTHAPNLVDASLTNYSAGMESYRKQQYEKSSILFRRATEAIPENPELRMYLGSSLIMTGDFDVAEKELRVAAQLAHGEHRQIAQLLLARAQLDRGDQATARETLAQVAGNGGVWGDKARSLLAEFPGMP
jgi:predicted Zn-dependent protease